MTEWVGIELPGIYDGVSVWVHRDTGEVENRWADLRHQYPDDNTIEQRYVRTQAYIDAYAGDLRARYTKEGQ